MNIEVIVQDSETGKGYDISDLVTDITWETQLSGQPGKLTVKYIEDPLVKISEGSIIRFKLDNEGVFFGYVFIIKDTDKGIPSLIAYDQTRYLKNKDTYVIIGMTASEVFSKLCKDFNLSYTVVSPSTYKIANRVFDDKTLFEIIETSIDETLAFSKEWYMIKDNFGKLEFHNLNDLKTNLIIGDKSLLTGYDHERSIDTDTYNQVKLSQENKDTQKREIYIVKDSSTMQKWGTLQYTQKVDEDVNPSQIEELAEQLLSLKNRPTKTLSVNCIGDLRVSSGNGVIISISDLVSKGMDLNQYYVVTSASHKFSNNEHTMKLELQVSV